MSSSQSKSSKRKRSSSPEINLRYKHEPSKDTASKLIRSSIAQLTAIPDLPTASFAPLLDTLNDAYKSAILLEDLQTTSAAQIHRVEDWNWQLTAEKVASMSVRELEVWKEFVVCRKDLEDSLRPTVHGIRVNPAAWQDPQGDLLQWQAHIPGPKDTSWDGRVYTVTLIFHDKISDNLPKLKFLPPLCHPNCFPSGTWSNRDLAMIRAGDDGLFLNGRTRKCQERPDTWLKTIDDRRLAKFLRALQEGLDDPNVLDPAQSDAYTLIKFVSPRAAATLAHPFYQLTVTVLFRNHPLIYQDKIKEQAKAWTPHPKLGLAGRAVLAQT